MFWKVDVLGCSLAALVCAMSVPPCSGQPAEPHDHETGAEKFNLRWKFSSGEVIRVEHRVVKRFARTVGTNHVEHTYNYSWIVDEVTNEGTAKIKLRFEEIAFMHGDSPIGFHTSSDHPTDFRHGDDSDLMKYQARAMANAEISFEVLPHGGTRDIYGAESISDARSFTPGDLPGLPDHPVAIGDSWKLPIQAGAMKGESICKLTSIDRVSEHRIAKIECVANWQSNLPFVWNELRVQLEPTKSVSHFDIDAGRFLEEEQKSVLHVTASRRFRTEKRSESIANELTNVAITQLRRIAIDNNPTDPVPQSGSYLLVYKDGRFEEFVVAGAKVRQPTDSALSVEGLFEVDFFHSWEDEDQDRQPNPEELNGINTRFIDHEDIRFLVTMLGMQDRRLHLELLDANGSEVAKNVIPIRPGPGAIALREVRLPAGIYFFEFFVDEKFILRVPVQVFSSDHES